MRTPRICSIVALLSALVPPTGIAQESVVMVERFVPHISTVPANTGDRVSPLSPREAHRDNEAADRARPAAHRPCRAHGARWSGVVNPSLRPRLQGLQLDAPSSRGRVRHLRDGSDGLRAVATADDGRPVQHRASGSGNRDAESAPGAMRPALLVRADNCSVRLGRDRHRGELSPSTPWGRPSQPRQLQHVWGATRGRLRRAVSSEGGQAHLVRCRLRPD